MDEKRWETYLDEVLSFVKFKYDHKDIRRELAEHMADLKEDLMADGMDEEAAEYMTIAHMGDAEEIGQELDKEHHALLGWVWYIAKVIAIFMLALNFPQMYVLVSNMTVGYFEEYEPQTDAPLVWQMQLDEEYQIYDDTLILGSVYYYEDGLLEMTYWTKRNPFARSIDWSLSVGIDGYDSEGNRIPHAQGGGFKSGGYYGFGTEHMNEVPSDIKTLKIYCTEQMTLSVDLETGEVTEDAET